jgi:hypothetical protein
VRSKISILAPALLLTLSVALSAFDWGGTIDNSTTLYTLDAATLEQRDKITLWIGHEFDTSADLFTAASYTYALSDPLLLDLERLQVDFLIGQAVSATVGRFVLSEFTYLVLDHPLDGIRLVYNLPAAVITVGAGYTGLLFKEPSLIRMSRSDTTDLDDEDSYLAPPRLIELVEAIFPELIRSQDFTVSLIAQQDLRRSVIEAGEENAVVTGLSGGRLHSFYLGLGLSGALGTALPLYSELYAYAGTGTALSYVDDPASGTGFSWQVKPQLSFLGGGGLSYFLKGAAKSRITGSLLFSSGDSDADTFREGNTDGMYTQFVPISRPEFGLLFSPQLGNMILASLGYSFAPFSSPDSALSEKLRIELNAMSFLRPTTGASSGTGIDPLSDAYYLATEVDGIIKYRPFSDLAVVLSTGLLVPNPEAFSGEYTRLQFLGRLELSFSF